MEANNDNRDKNEVRPDEAVKRIADFSRAIFGNNVVIIDTTHQDPTSENSEKKAS